MGKGNWGGRRRYTCEAMSDEGRSQFPGGQRGWNNAQARRLGKPRALLPACIPEGGGVWADLGCGEGIFTAVLCALLGPNSIVFALDRNAAKLRALRRNASRSFSGAGLLAVRGDFKAPLPFDQLDGVLVANALHFIPQQHKPAVLAGMLAALKPGGRFVLVEYNTSRGTPAVPHPISSVDFLRLGENLPLRSARIAATTPSSYLGEMYAAVALRE
jgi:SAM-dependent methyltransferase